MYYCIHISCFSNIKHFISAIKLYIIYQWEIYTLLWHEYNHCTKYPSEVFTIAHFCTYFLIFLGEDPQTPPFHFYFLRVCFTVRNSYQLYVKMSPKSFLLPPPLFPVKKQKKKSGPPFSEILEKLKKKCSDNIICNMDNTLVSCIHPSSVILCQIVWKM